MRRAGARWRTFTHGATMATAPGIRPRQRSLHLLGRIEGFRHVCPSTCLPPSPSFAWRNRIVFPQPDHRMEKSCIARSPVHTVAMRMQGSATAQRTKVIRSGSLFATSARIGQIARQGNRI